MNEAFTQWLRLLNMAIKSSRFPARAASTTGDEEKVVNGALVVEGQSLQFQGGTLKSDMPYEELELGSQKNSPVTFTHPDHSAWRVTAYEQRILKEVPFSRHANLSLQIKEARARNSGLSRVIAATVFIATFLGVTFVIGFFIEESIPAITANIPVEFETELGSKLSATVLNDRIAPDFPNMTNSVKLLNSLLDQIVPKEAREIHNFRIHLIDDPQPNAFSLPGGDIFIYSGLLTWVQNPNQVAGVLAHEVAHIIQRNGLRFLVSQDASKMFVQHLMGKRAPILANIRTNAKKLLTHNLPTHLLVAADKQAFTYLLEANISPKGLNRFLYRLWELEGKAQYVGLTLPLSQRPRSKERLAALASLNKTLPEGVKYNVIPKIPAPPRIMPDPDPDSDSDI